MIALILAAAVMVGVFIPWALNNDRADECHLMHGPRSNCPECESK